MAALVCAAACGAEPPTQPRASGYVEATEVQAASRVPGRVVEMRVSEGDRVGRGDVLVRLDPAELDLALRRAQAERDQAVAALRLLQAGSRPEDVSQAQAQSDAAGSERQAAQAELDAASREEARFEQLLANRAGSEKQRDDAAARRRLAQARLSAADDRARSAEAALARVNAGARPEEVAAARARVAAVEAQIAAIEHDLDELDVEAPSAGTVTGRLVESGELVGPGQPLAVIVDLERAWVNAYVEEPLVPALRIGGAVTIVTDAGDRLQGAIAFISPQAEFTPRNVQTSAERAKLVYRVRIDTDNREGILKPGMPVEVELGAP
jgi:HlyD family secretion protein